MNLLDIYNNRQIEKIVKKKFENIGNVFMIDGIPTVYIFHELIDYNYHLDGVYKYRFNHLKSILPIHFIFDGIIFHKDINCTIGKGAKVFFKNCVFNSHLNIFNKGNIVLENNNYSKGFFVTGDYHSGNIVIKNDGNYDCFDMIDYDEDSIFKIDGERIDIIDSHIVAYGHKISLCGTKNINICHSKISGNIIDIASYHISAIDSAFFATEMMTVWDIKNSFEGTVYAPLLDYNGNQFSSNFDTNYIKDFNGNRIKK